MGGGLQELGRQIPDAGNPRGGGSGKKGCLGQVCHEDALFFLRTLCGTSPRCSFPDPEIQGGCSFWPLVTQDDSSAESTVGHGPLKSLSTSSPPAILAVMQGPRALPDPSWMDNDISRGLTATHRRGPVPGPKQGDNLPEG